MARSCHRYGCPAGGCCPLARLVVLAAAIGAALVLLALLVPSPARGAGPAHPVGLAAGVSLVLAALPLRWWGAIAAQRRQASPPAATASSWQGGPEAPPMGGSSCASRGGPRHITRPQNGILI
jgi:hypothetical protein